MQDPLPQIDEYLTLADVVGVYGVKGWVKLRPRLEDTALLTSLPQLYLCGPAGTKPFDKGGLQVEAVRHQGKGLIAKLANVDDRTAAEALNGFEIRIPANVFPSPDDGDFYWRDLMGLAVWCRENETRVLLGTVDRLLETGANDVLVVVPTEQSVDDKDHLVPWIPDSVIVEVDLEGGKIEVNWYVDT